MSNASHDFVSVDMRGMKAALVAHARARRVGVSTVVRAAVARELQREERVRDSAASPLSEKLIKVSIRLSSAEAEQLAAGAQEAGLSRSAYVAALIGGGVVTRRADHLTALTASCAELAILSRNLYRLASLFRQGSSRAAQEYREMLDSLRSEVRRHLQVAADALADLRSRRTRPPRTPPIHQTDRKT
jgi:hypothetical protein